ncbi:peptidase C1 [Sphingopyxis sp. H050]|jgi:hypothetical protein|uniref:C1 family peptidase n=1 Tax=Sphingopyxis sp. H050 TaxID=1759072 RepID=UPI000736A78C|nr:C1 family peptidase [Sphingopyxis sp. H050]KTE19815.1 peptidase C1 [Sphingopyxis sp. H050]
MIAIKTDLRHLLGPVRDQGARPTCLAFAASDGHAALRDGTPLSCEYAYFHAQRRGGRAADQGATLSTMLDALRLDGQPAESGWPYLDIVPGDEWAPPAMAGPCFGRKGGAATLDFSSILASLDANRPVLLLSTLSVSFFQPTGEGLVDPANDEMPDASLRHAILAVGHGLADGQSAILVRNSWGVGWGVEGHAWLTEKFLKPRLFATAILTEEIDVPSHSAAA